MSAEIEMRWIDAWDELYELLKEHHGDVQYGVQCLLPDGRVVDVEECLGWLQESAYNQYYLKVDRGWVWGKHGIVISRSLNKIDRTQPKIPKTPQTQTAKTSYTTNPYSFPLQPKPREGK